MEFIDLKAQYAALGDRIDAGIAGVLRHGQFIMGPEVAAFEDALARYVGRAHCVSCANGTDALQLVYMVYGIGAGDAVFCPDITFIASVEPACMLGAVPVFCDILPDTYNLDPASLERQVKAVLAEGRYRPKAVVVVDFLGNPADYDALAEVCKRYDLLLIEDAAQSMGASYHGKKCGSLGDIATTSFFPAKPLGCYGDGGAVFTDSAEMAELLRSYRVHGKGPRGKYDNVRIGLNSRLDTLQAAVLLVKLMALPVEQAVRQKVAARYNEAFAGRFVTPFVRAGCESAYAQYALLTSQCAEESRAKCGVAGERFFADGDISERDAALEALNAAGIPNMVYYSTPMHALPVFAAAPHYGMEFAVANDYCSRTFSLPMSAYVTRENVDEVAQSLVKSLHRKYL